jgi:hypothetical protein
MGVIREADTPVVLDDSGTVLRMTEAGDMTVELDVLEPNLNVDHLFEGLPDDCCQAEHWGYVIEGEIRYEMHEGDDVVAVAGDAYYVPPGHRPHSGTKGAKVVEFSKTEDMAKTMEVVERNMESAGR